MKLSFCILQLQSAYAITPVGKEMMLSPCDSQKTQSLHLWVFSLANCHYLSYLAICRYNGKGCIFIICYSDTVVLTVNLLLLCAISHNDIVCPIVKLLDFLLISV